MRFWYSMLLYVLCPLLLLRMLWRSRRAPAYRQRIAERFGIFPAPASGVAPVLWVHAVSVGEVVAAAPLVEQLLQDYPEHQLMVTTATPTGAERAQTLFGERVFHVYLPWDLPGSVQRFLRRTQPQLLVLMETELWPNLLHYSRAQGCKILLANARMSRRSARGYGRVAPLVRQMLTTIDCAACQNAADGERFTSLGLPPAVLHITGSIKFDVQIDEVQQSMASELRRALCTDERPVLVAGSTHAGEEEQVLAAFRQLRETWDNCLLILIPRHPERFDVVRALCEGQGWLVASRSLGELPGSHGDILLGDTMGELPVFYGAATVAFVGGSLVERGGHNPLEAAVWGIPVVCGSCVYNFEAVCKLLAEAGVLQVLDSADQLAGCVAALLHNSVARAKVAKAAQQVFSANRGALKKVNRLVADTLAGQ